MNALAAPGEVVGTVAAQSIGEPTTQVWVLRVSALLSACMACVHAVVARRGCFTAG